MAKEIKREPSMVDALIPMIFLIGTLTLAVYLFGEDASWGLTRLP